MEKSYLLAFVPVPFVCLSGFWPWSNRFRELGNSPQCVCVCMYISIYLYVYSDNYALCLCLSFCCAFAFAFNSPVAVVVALAVFCVCFATPYSSQFAAALNGIIVTPIVVIMITIVMMIVIPICYCACLTTDAFATVVQPNKCPVLEHESRDWRTG